MVGLFNVCSRDSGAHCIGLTRTGLLTLVLGLKVSEGAGELPL